jgi:nucleotide-binding universal stress UspA family protein
MAAHEPGSRVRRSPVVNRPDTTSVADFAGASFPFRDLVVARTYDPRADAAAMRAARALSERMPSVAIVRCEEDALEREVRHAALVLAGCPDRRRPATRPGGDASALARRLRVPVMVVPQAVGLDLTGVRSIVCGVEGRRDTTTVLAAGALADALDLQLVLVHVWDEPAAAAPGPLVLSAGPFDTARPGTLTATRELLGDVARRAGRSGPGAACLRVIDGPVADTLCRAGGDEHAALIAVTASRHGPFTSALRGSVARHVTRHADRPVLVCPTDVDPALALGAHRR